MSTGRWTPAINRKGVALSPREAQHQDMTTAAPARDSENPYLNGNYAPVREEITAVDLEVTGAIPEYLDGRYLRIGPNPIGDPDPAKYHWFVGAGMAHGLRMRDGEAHWYRNRWVRSAEVSRAARRNVARRAFQRRVRLRREHQYHRTGRQDAGHRRSRRASVRMTDELETVGPSDFCGTLFAGYTAHPKRDPVTGDLHAVSYNPMRGNIVQYTVTGVDGRVRRTVNVRLRAQTMMHDFSLTEKYVVLYDLPVALDLGTGRAAGRPRRCAGTPDAIRRASRRTGFLPARRDARIGARRRVTGRHALPVGAGAPGPRRGDAARRHRGGHPLVRGATLLCVPPAQRL